ncbi:MAG: tetratricopeptide repeat protein [Nitrospirae bacterium]|nr:tetratricopeptide repeat protein [Nitrospirota bacterium]
MGKASQRKEQVAEKADAFQTTSIPPNLWTRPPVALLLASLLATLIYSNTFSVPFHFDDIQNIVENPRIKYLSNFLDLSGSRYVGFLSFALNYHFGGLHVFGYHLVNLLIHITNGFLVYTLVLLLFKIPISGETLGPAPTDHGRNELRPYVPFVALATALLFIAHPLQTQAVTYIIQRFASLAALFYLLTVVAYLTYRLAQPESRNRFLWYGMALLSTILAMKTKENSFTLPLMILMIEAVFFRPQIKKQWVTLLPFLATLLIIPLSHIDAVGEAEGGFAQETTEISRGDYLFTQFRVIVTYLRLLVLPINQNLDYDYPVYHSFLDPSVFFSFLLLAILLGLALYLLFPSRLPPHPSRLTAFGILWFFLTFSIESSIIPIRDVIFEHRVYLPSVGFFLSCIAGAFRGLEILRTRVQQKGLLFLIYHPTPVALFFFLILISFSSATYQRNRIWKDEVSLWEDVVHKATTKARGHNNLGFAYKDQRRLEEAVQEFQVTLRINPNYAGARRNLGNAYQLQGQLKEAIAEYKMALSLEPGDPSIHYNLGLVYQTQGMIEKAMEEFQTASRISHGYPEATYALGLMYHTQGRLDEAIQYYETALRRKPDDTTMHYNLGLAYQEQGKMKMAIQEFETALKLDPEYPEAAYALGFVYQTEGQLDEAIRQYQAALRVKPDNERIHTNLGNAYQLKGWLEKAIQEYQIALQLKPEDAAIHYNFGLAYQQQGQIAQAKGEFLKALEIKPDFVEARRSLESIHK